MAEKQKISKQEMSDRGYVYCGETCNSNHKKQANQYWWWRDELIVYDPENEIICWRQYDELFNLEKSN